MGNQKNKSIYTVQQENLCLETKILIDKLRTNLLLIEEFNPHEYDKWNYKLKSLKKKINDIYWNV